MFLESQPIKRDIIHEIQLRWYEFGLLEGLTINNFLVVTWNFKRQD